MVSQLTQSPSENSLRQDDPQKLERIRHTCAHILAMAVQTLFPETKVTIGPTTDTGFYYDFDRKQPFTPDDLSHIEAKMRLLIKANLPIICEVVDREQIRAEIEQLGEPYKLEILDSIPEGETITRYFIGNPDRGKIPVVVVVGKREVESQTLSVRTRKGGELGTLTVAELQACLQGAIEEKSTL